MRLTFAVLGAWLVPTVAGAFVTLRHACSFFGRSRVVITPRSFSRATDEEHARLRADVLADIADG